MLTSMVGMTAGVSVLAIASAALAFVRPSIPAFVAAVVLNGAAAYLYLSIWLEAGL